MITSPSGDQHVLVSIGNFGAARPDEPEDPRPTCLLRLDVDSQHWRWVDVGCADEPLVAGLGICSDDRYVYHVSLAKTESNAILTVLDRGTLHVQHVQQLPEIADVHSIQRLGNELVVASTGTDEIVGYELDGYVASGGRVVWSPTGSGVDSHHINSLAVIEGRLFCSAFGSREGGSWTTAKNGYVHNVTGDTRVLDGLRQPHSVTFHDGHLYYCNSQEGTVNSAEDVVAHLVGYARGLAFGADGTIYAATSLSRRGTQTTDNTAEFLNLGDPGVLNGRCAVVKIPPGGSRLEMGLSPAGYEIYDLLLI
jgi:hypothetical protein